MFRDNGYLWIELGTLLHESTDSEPERVGKSEIVVQELWLGKLRRVGTPFLGAESRHNKKRHGHYDVGGQDVNPYFDGEGVHETE